MRSGSVGDPTMIESSSSGERLMPSMSSSSSSSGVGHLVGRTIGQYQVSGLIAQGGMGAVYEARHTRLNRLVALKVMLPGMDASGEDVQRVLREAHAAARLTHPNLVPIYDVGDHHGVRYLAMELVRGDTLHALIRRRGQLPEKLALELVMGSALGLQHAHEQGVLHRDLKPANIIVQADGTPRLTDFGVAKATGDSRLTATGTALGTPQYMSPEQAMGLNQELDARTDIYGLGAILYECLTGQPPFNLGSHVATMNAVVNDKPVPPGKHREGLSDDAQAICLKCLRKNPDDRYSSANELVADIESCLRGRTIRARVPAVWKRAWRKAHRNAVISSLVLICGGVFLAFLIVLAIPTIHDRRVAQLERHTHAAAAARLDQEALAVAAASEAGDAAALEAVLARLELDALTASLRDSMAVGEDADSQRAFERGLSDLPDLLRQPAADAALALARLREGAPRLESLAEAELAAPQSPAGRSARLAMLQALRERGLSLGPFEGELLDLASGDDALAAAARVELAEVHAARWRWDRVASLLAAIQDNELDAATGARLQGLRVGEQTFGKAVELPAYTHVTALPGNSPSRLVTYDSQNNLRLLGAPKEADGPLQEIQRLVPNAPLSHLAAADLAGDDQPDLLMGMRYGSTQRTGLVAISLRGGNERKVLWEEDGARIADLAVGELDGQAGDEVVVLLRGTDPQVRVCSGEANDSRAMALEGAHAWGTASAELTDLDGDGVDELAVGCTMSPAGVMLLRVGEKRLEPLRAEPLRIGRVIRVRALHAGQRPLLLAVVDFGAKHLDREGGAPPGPGWWWRDGVYVIGWEDGPELVARWTYGADEPPTRESADATSGLSAWSFEADGETWLARLATVDGQRVLEATPLGSLSLETTPRPALRLILDSSWPSFSSHVPSLDVDQDGDLERLVGTSLGPLSDRPGAPPWRAPGQPVETSRSERLLAIVRRLSALGELELAQRFLRELEGSSVTDAALGRLARVDGLLDEGARRERLAQQAFANLDPRRGAELRDASFAALHQAGELAAEVGRDPRTPAGTRSRAWQKSAFAFLRGCEEARALDVLREASTASLAPEMADDLARQIGQLKTWGSLSRKDMVSASTLLASSPFLVWRRGETVALRCEPDTDAELSVPLDLGPARLPLVLETEVEVPNSAWASSLLLGVKRFKTDLDVGQVSSLLAGFQLDLWHAETGTLGLTASAGGYRHRCRLPAFPQRLKLRMELLPLGSGTRVALWVWSDGALVHSAISTHGAVHIPRHVLLTAQSPRHTSLDGALVPAAHGIGASVTLKHLTLESVRAVEVTKTVGTAALLTRAAHGSLVSQRSDLATSYYNALISKPQTTAESAEACLGALSFSTQTPDLVTRAIQYDPLTALRLLEEASEALIEERPQLLARVRAGLDQAVQSTDATTRLVAQSLRGDHRHGQMPAELNKNWDALSALLRRLKTRLVALQNPKQAESWLPRLTVTQWVRLPLVRRIPSITPLNANELNTLLGEQEAHCLECRHDLLYRHRATATAPDQLASLAKAQLALGFGGEWERTNLRLLASLTDVQPRRDLLLSLAEQHRARGHMTPLSDVVRQLAELNTPEGELEPFRQVLGEARFARAVGASD
jgi:hypothetical protein